MLDRLTGVFASLNSHDVKYVVIGGIAAVLHGVPRATFDLDVLIEATPDNARRLLDALSEAGLGTASMTTAEDVLAHEITVFQDRVRIDVQTSTPGITFKEAWRHHQTMEYKGQPLHVVSRGDLIAAKRAAGRDVDLADVRELEAGEAGDTQAGQFLLIQDHAAEDVFARLTDLVPGFRTVWEDSLFVGEDGSFTAHGVFSEFSTYVREHLAEFSEETRTSLFRYIEQCVTTNIHSDAGVSNAACTCFLENIAGEGDFSLTVQRYLGPESRKYFDLWNAR